MPLPRVAATLLVAVFAAGEAEARCTDQPMSKTVTLVQNFLIRPEGLLERFPGGDKNLSIIVREIVTADPNATLDPVIKLLRSANGPQRRAVGAGLGNAARLCNVGSDSSTARRIQEIVRRQNDSALNMGFTSASTERTSVPLVPSTSTEETQNALGRDPITNPRTNLFKSDPLPNPLTPLRLAPP
ncbi:hypothetical protein [Methylorubrum aminovorans]